MVGAKKDSLALGVIEAIGGGVFVGAHSDATVVAANARVTNRKQEAR